MGSPVSLETGLDSGGKSTSADRSVTDTEAKSKSRGPWLGFKQSIPRSEAIVLGVAIWLIFFGAWEVADVYGWVNPRFMPPPHLAIFSLITLFTRDAFLSDVGASVYRIVVSFGLAAAIAVPLGILMGSFRRVEAFVNPLVSAWRYLPAPSFIPLLLMWFGTGNVQKISLLFIGVVWFLITIIMDHVKMVRTELIETALTLGGNRWKILWTVVIPASMPSIVVAMRQMLAVSWTYLVIAEIVAATDGIGAMMMRAQRFMHVDNIMAGIITIGFLGLLFDFLFRLVHKLMFPYLEEYGR